MKSKQVVCFISSPPREQLRHAHAAALTPALTGGCHGDDLLKSLYKSLYKNAKDPTLSILGHHGGREKSCVFAATVLDPSDTQRQTRTGRPFSVLYRTRPAAFCPYPGGLNFGQIGSASPTQKKAKFGYENEKL